MNPAAKTAQSWSASVRHPCQQSPRSTAAMTPRTPSRQSLTTSRPALGRRGRVSTATPPAGAVLAAHQVETSTSGCRWGLTPVATRPGRFTEQQCILSTTSTVMVTLPSGFGSTRSRALGADLTHSVVHSRGAALRRRGTDDGPRRHSDRGHDTVRFIPGRIVGSGHGIGLGRSVQMGASHPCRRTEAAALAAAAATGDVGVNWRCTHPSGPHRPRRRHVAAAR
jgi:hypothetical protein